MAKASPDKALGHWSKLFESLQASPAEFYKQVEVAVAERKILGVVIERVEYREGGAFSGFREYLRVARRRDVFDVCGDAVRQRLLVFLVVHETEART